MEVPNPKHQISNKSQSPKFEKNYLVICNWNLELVWNLGFGICDFGRHALCNVRR